jgi:hypothetical protein
MAKRTDRRFLAEVAYADRASRIDPEAIEELRRRVGHRSRRGLRDHERHWPVPGPLIGLRCLRAYKLATTRRRRALADGKVTD